MRDLTDKELIELALQSPEDDLPSDDIEYYRQSRNIIDGKNKIYTKHLHYDYCKFSNQPVELDYFHDRINLGRKSKNCVYLNKAACNVDLDRILGDYVREKKVSKKEAGFR